MYSFQYDEGESWVVWPNDVSLSMFAKYNSEIVIKQIFRRLFDDVKDRIKYLRNELQDNMLHVKTNMNELLTALKNYLTSVRVDETFVRYDTSSSSQFKKRCSTTDCAPVK